LVALLLVPAWAGEDPRAEADKKDFDELFDKVLALKDPRWRARAFDLERQIRKGTWQERPGQKREVHGVGLFRGKVDPRGTATVEVTRTGPGIVLVLCGYESIEWRVKLKEGVKLEKLLLLGRKNQTVRGVDPKLVKPIGRLFVLNRRDAAFPQLEAAVAARTGGQRMDTYVSGVDPGNRAVVVGPGGEAWQRQMLLKAMRDLHWSATRKSRDARLARMRRFVFPTLLWDRRRGAVTCDATVGGSISDTMRPAPRRAFAFVVDPDTGRRYFLGYGHIEEHSADGRQLARLEVPPWIGPRNWVAAIAYDGRRKRLVLATLGGTYAAYDLESRAWQRMGARPHQQMAFVGFASSDGLLAAFTHDPGRDCYWALHVNGARFTLHRLDLFGKSVRRVRLKARLSVQAGSRSGAPLYVLGKNLAILSGNMAGRRRTGYTRTTVVDPETGAIVLQTEFRRLPRLEAPPREDWNLLWGQLSGHDPYSAMRLFARGRAPSVEFLRRKWEEIPRPPEEAIRRALRDLDAPEPQVRSHAFAVLSQGGTRLTRRLETEIEKQESPEVRLSLRRLLDQYESQPDLRGRLIRLLEGVDAPGAATLRRQLRSE
jgi:hypothetical protein